MTQRSSRRWRWPARGLALAGSLVAVVLVFRRLDVAALTTTLRTLHWGWYLGAQAIFGLGLLGSAIRWHLMLRLNHEAVVHGAASVRMVFISQFFNVLLGGPGGGDLPKTAVYARWFGVPASDVLAASVLDRLSASLGGLVFALTAVALGASSGAFEFLHRLQWRAPSVWIWPAVLGVLGLVAGLLVWAWRRPRSFAGRSLHTLVGSIRHLLASKRRAGQALGCAFTTAMLFNLTQALCLQAVSPEPIPWLRLLWMYHLVTMIASMPVTFAGAGLREGASMVLLGQYGIPATSAVAAAMLTLSVHLTWATFGGLLLARERHQRRRVGRARPPRTISVVIPALNEADALPETLRRLRAVPEIQEVILVDGGSEDRTAELARELGCRVLSAPRGRGGQLRAGAEVATGDVVLLLHADTWLTPDAGAAMFRALRDPLVVGGGYWKKFRQPTWLMRGSRFRCWLRLWWNGRVLGDQAIFVRRDCLSAIGGVPDQPLMEELELCRRLRQRGRLALAGAAVTTSERRFRKFGVLRTYWLMWRVSRAYRRGVSPRELEGWYRRG